MYNFQSYCDKLASMEGDDGFVREDCLSQEREYRGLIQSGWQEVPPEISKNCREMTEAYEASYTALYYCVLSEIEAEGGVFPAP